MSEILWTGKIAEITKFATGESPSKIIPLGQGATSAAWRVDTGPNAVVVRIIPAGTPRPITYQSEFTVLRLLEAKDCPVPSPILNSAARPNQLTHIQEPWAVTKAIEGQAIKKSQLSKTTAKNLGELLAALHSLPVTQFGRLAEQTGGVVGLQNDAISGVCARWCWAPIWPFDDCHLEQHTLSNLDAHIAAQLKDLKPTIFKAATEDRAVLVHSDLHGEHIFEKDEKLTGVIDFGASFIGAPAWDFAVIAYYHGWAALEALLTGYTSSGKVQSYQLKQAQKLGVAVSLYKLAKGLKGRPTPKKLNKITDFLNQTMQAIEKIG
ncbi:MAG: aminoglycoside phosphotransferase family protein [Chloroflexota bacterium]